MMPMLAMHHTLTRVLWTGALWAALMGCMSATSAGAFTQGEVFAAIGNGQVVRFSKALERQETLDTGRGGYTTGMAFDAKGNLYVTNFSAGSITRFDMTGAIIAPNPFVTTEPDNESIVFDPNGNFYVGVARSSTDIFKFAPDGTLLDRFDVATETLGSDWIDLAADRKTMFYTSEGRRIFRFDVHTKTQLPDFARLPDDGGKAFALRLLPHEGGMLVADMMNIKRLDAEGNVIQTYDMAGQDGWFALNLDPDGTSFWSGDARTQTLVKFDIATGRVLTQVVTGGTLRGVAVFGEITVVRPAPLAEGPAEEAAPGGNWLEELMDVTTLLATYALLAFLVERLTNGMMLLMGYWHWWRVRFDVAASTDPARQNTMDRNRRVVLFGLSAAVAIVGAVLTKLDLLPQINVKGVPATAGQILTGLLIASGADPIREIIQQRERKREEPPPPTPLQVTGTLILQQPTPAAPDKTERERPGAGGTDRA